MGYGAVGLVMLAIVLLFYLRMVSDRFSLYRRPDNIRALLDKAEVFESVADDQSALKVIESGLIDHPDQPDLISRKKAIEQRIRDADNNDSSES